MATTATDRLDGRGGGGDDDVHDALLEALRSIEDVLKDPTLTEAERAACVEELGQLEAQRERLVGATLKIAAFGIISSGKSSLLNALTGHDHFKTAVRGGETKVAAEEPWTIRVPGFPPVVVIDTPGIGEVGGEARADLALEAARAADLVLFVTEKDLTHSEMEAFRALHAVGKPIIYVINKRDNYTRAQREELREVVSRRLAGLVEPASVVLTASDPKEVEVQRELPDGRIVEEWRKPAPYLEELEDRLLDVLARSGRGHELVALNVLLQAGDAGERMAQKRLDIRRREADRVTVWYALLSGTTIAAIPVPAVDLLGKMAVDAAMVYHLGARVYQEDIDKDMAKGLIRDIAKGMGVLAAVELGTVGLGSLLKSVPLIGTIAGAFVQAVTASYYTFAYGQIATIYFEQKCSWGARSVNAVTRDVMDRLRAHRGILTTEFKDYITRRAKGQPASLAEVVQRLRGAGAIR